MEKQMLTCPGVLLMIANIHLNLMRVIPRFSTAKIAKKATAQIVEYLTMKERVAKNIKRNRKNMMKFLINLRREIDLKCAYSVIHSHKKSKVKNL